MGGIRTLLLAVVWLLPGSRVKNAALRLLGHQVHTTAHAGPNFVWKVGNVRMGEQSVIRRFNIIKKLREVHIDDCAAIGNRNLISAHPVYARYFPSGSRLELAPYAAITTGHRIDCAGGVKLGEYSLLAGHHSLILTHSIDLQRDAQSAHPVEIGARSFVGTSVVILGGATLPPRSVLAAGAVLTRSHREQTSGVWAGVPARYVGPIGGAWFDRSNRATLDIYVPGAADIVRRAI